VTFNAGEAGKLFNLVVRGLAFSDGQLLVSRWRGGYCFPVGGRLDHGESLEDAIRRELREETGVSASVRKLVYFNENFFTDDRGMSMHELGWFYWVALESPVGGPGLSLSHPDSTRLSLEYVALDRLEAEGLVPPFLRVYLPGDYADRFAHAPRHIVSSDRRDQPPALREIAWGS
jgi:ADP-ribose pyrophosphatase YjhB (NUDIX family)